LQTRLGETGIESFAISSFSAGGEASLESRLVEDTGLIRSLMTVAVVPRDVGNHDWLTHLHHS
jgi:hypothetical protein